MLEFKITKGGQLFIKRGSKWKRQYCALSCAASDYMSGPTANCTDNCPLFGEPDRVTNHTLSTTSDKITLCHGKYLVGTLIDERV